MSLHAETVMFLAPRHVEVQERALPEPSEGQVVVRALYSGISAGTEMNVYRGLAPQWHTRRDRTTGLFVPTETPEWSYPLAYGYAAVGKVEMIGGSVPPSAGLSVGQLVFSYTPHASKSVARWEDLVPLPDLPDPRLGVFLANVNTALNGVLDARPSLGDVVVVSGLGVIGLVIVQLLRRSGVGLVVGVDGIQRRRELARSLGADVALEPSETLVAQRVRELSENRGADIAIEVSGAAPALNEAIRAVGYGGRVVVLSWYGGSFETLNLAGEFHHNRPRVISSQVGGINPDLGPLWSVRRRQALATSLLTELSLEPMITQEFPVDQAAKAYQAIDTGDQSVVQCVLSYATAS